MAKDEKDVKDDQVVSGQGADAQVAAGQGVESQVAPDKTAEGQQVQDDQKIPLARFNEVNERMKEAERDAQLARDQMALLQANQTQTQPVQQPAVSTYQQAVRECGLEGEDYMTQEQQAQVFARKEQLDVFKLQQQQAYFADQQFMQNHADFGTVAGQINPYTGQFMATPELNEILMKKPYLRASCGTAQGAYEVVMEQRRMMELTKKTEVQEQHQQQQDVDTKLAPMSAAGGGAVDKSAGEITESSTADDVEKMQQRVQTGEFG